MEFEFPKELAEALDTQAKDVAALTVAVGLLVEALKTEEVVVEESKAPTAAAIADALVESGLGAKARTRVLASVTAGTDLAEAIQAEKDIAAEVLEEAKASKEFVGFIEESDKGDSGKLDVWG